MSNQQDLQTTIATLTAKKQALSSRLLALAEIITQQDAHAAQLLDKQTDDHWSLDTNAHELVYSVNASTKATVPYTYTQLTPYLETIMAQLPTLTNAVNSSQTITVIPTTYTVDKEAPYNFKIANIKGVDIYISQANDNHYHVAGYVKYIENNKPYYRIRDTKRPIPLERLQDTIARIVITLN